jgi:hypothetical protein
MQHKNGKLHVSFQSTIVARLVDSLLHSYVSRAEETWRKILSDSSSAEEKRSWPRKFSKRNLITYKVLKLDVLYLGLKICRHIAINYVNTVLTNLR